MSIETPEDAHDPAQTARERATNDDGAAAAPDDETAVDPDDGASATPDDGTAAHPDDELVVVICPRRTYEQLRPEIDESRERLCRKYEREYEDLLAERAHLADEVDALERQLRRKESQLDAVVARNEQILEARTESYRRRIEGRDEADGFQWTGSRQEAGTLVRLKNWLR